MKPRFQYLSSAGKYLLFLYMHSDVTNQERTDISSGQDLGCNEKFVRVKYLKNGASADKKEKASKRGVVLFRPLDPP